jgi:IclR family acetate operon transcriptional repressor
MICKLSSNPQTTHQLLITCANDEMKRLSEISGETISLDIVVGIETILLHQVRSQHGLQVAYELKSTDKLLPIGSTGKVLLSQFNDEELDVIIKNLTWSSLVENIGINKEILVSELKQIREKGYAISHGERLIGAIGLSAPILNYTQPAALTIAGYDHRLLPKVSSLIEELKTSVIRISERVAGIFKLGGFY